MQISIYTLHRNSCKLAEPITQRWQMPLKRELPKDTMKVGLFSHLHIAPHSTLCNTKACFVGQKAGLCKTGATYYCE